MSINDVRNLFLFCGGLGMFLYGMKLMSDGIQRNAGNKMKELLGILTSNRVIGVLVGALITTIIQSSGATTVMVVGFVNAGLMTLGQAVGVIMGANIGTCITAWIVSMGQLGDNFAAISPDLYAPLLVGIGAFLVMFSKKERKVLIGEVLIGLGLLFLGLMFMKDSAGEYTDLPIFTDAFSLFGSNPILGILIGIVVTGIMQSSSASVGILQALAGAGGVVTAASAIYISLGSNIGSCFTALLSSMGSGKNAKRAAVIHLSFNVIGCILFGTILCIVFAFNHELRDHSINSVGIAIFHTLFNMICTVLLLPFAEYLVKLSKVIVPDGKDEKAVQVEEEPMEVKVARHLDSRIMGAPAFAIESVIQEIASMGDITYENAVLAQKAVKTLDSSTLEEILKKEETINQLEKILTEYLVKISNLSMTEEQHTIVNNLFYTVSDIERIGDHVENLAEQVAFMIKNKLNFSQTGLEDLDQMMDLTLQSVHHAVECRRKGSLEEIRQVVRLEDEVDNLEEELRDKHIERLSQNKCNPAAGAVFLDILSNLERMSDHAYNVVGYVKDEL